MWKHESKFKNVLFIGSYVTDKKGERNFVLSATKGKRNITFESWQMAKKVGWSKK